MRKILNFGHTLGHAIESYALSHREKRLLHGEAVAIGMILAAYISHKVLQFPWDKVEEIKTTLLEYFPQENFTSQEREAIQQLLKYDKKERLRTYIFCIVGGDRKT